METTNTMEKNTDREDSLTNFLLLSTTYLASSWLGYKTRRKRAKMKYIMKE